MATRTVLQSNRPYDHLYDPTYVTSHCNDHYRATNKAVFNARRIERVPDDRYMFSELPHYPRHTITITSKQELPDHVDRDWIAAERRGPVGSDADEVSGKYRHKFFTRPNKQILSTMPHIVMYAMKGATVRVAGTGGDVSAGMPMPSFTGGPEPLTKTVGTQSVYRESEAQTDPYSPDYTIAPNQSPEVLTLTHLTFNSGLPVSEAELQMIERTRQKRLFQQMLPPPTDEFNLQVRMQLMEAQEFRDWADRERQIRDLQEQRLALLQQVLEKKAIDTQLLGTEKIDRLRQRKEEERDRTLASCQRNRIKVLRKTQKERQAKEKHFGKRDVITEYADLTSKVYAPLARHGHIPDSNTARIEVQPADLVTYPGLVQLEQALPQSVLRAVDKHPKDLEKKKTSHKSRTEKEMASALKSAMESIKKELTHPSMEGGEMTGTGAKAGGGGGDLTAGKAPGEAPHPLGGKGRVPVLGKFLEREDAVQTKEDVLPEEEEQETAILLLQRIIRGRAYQNQMFEGKEKRLDLINELRAAGRFEDTATTNEEKRYVEQLRSKAFDDVLESVQGSVITQTLDQLSKELLRFQEERRIAAMVKLAERDRQLRQAQESGRRQAEERLREREDEMFRQIMGVHQGTVDSYLEDVLTNTVEQAAQSRALTEARLKAAKINSVVDTLEAAEQDKEVVVRELVHSFNLPHVQREVVKRRTAVENKRFSEAARGALDETYSRVEHEMTDK